MFCVVCCCVVTRRMPTSKLLRSYVEVTSKLHRRNVGVESTVPLHMPSSGIKVANWCQDNWCQDNWCQDNSREKRPTPHRDLDLADASHELITSKPSNITNNKSTAIHSFLCFNSCYPCKKNNTYTLYWLLCCAWPPFLLHFLPQPYWVPWIVLIDCCVSSSPLLLLLSNHGQIY